MSVLQLLTQRGLIQDITHPEELEKKLNNEQVCFYCGFDPTASSLTIGHLIPIVLMRWLHRAGHKPIAVIGSVTGMIGDPSFRSDERKLLDLETIEQNCEGQSKQLRQLLSSGGPEVQTVKNGDWLHELSMVDFLRNTGKHFTINAMLAKESVRGRLEDREQGISYTEFSYMLIQAYDFYFLNKTYNCELQIGGSDQWGNITAGIELIRRKSGKEAYGFTVPLLTRSDGKKMGKSEAGAVWLDPARTSPYAFYQYLLNTPDADAGKFLRRLTLIEEAEIAELEAAGLHDPESRVPQRRLAADVTEWIHGPAETERAIQASEILFSGDWTTASSETLEMIFSDVPSTAIAPSSLEQGMALPELLVHVGASDSKGAARRAIEGGGIYINNVRLSDPKGTVSRNDFIDGKVLVVRSGKKNYYLAHCE